MNRKTSTSRPKTPSQAEATMAQELRDFTALGRQILLEIDATYLPRFDSLMEQVGRAVALRS